MRRCLHSERGLANWISDRLWTHLVLQAESIPGMEMIEIGVTREITIGTNYRFRVKRHGVDGEVASYPTQTFLEFASQAVDSLPGLEEWKLIAGYDWDKDQRAIAAAVVSLRDGKDNVIWKKELPAVADEQGGGQTSVPEQPGPTDPTIGVPETLGQKAKGSEGE